MEKGFKDSPLKLNQSLKDLESFGEEEIKKRANDLADLAFKDLDLSKARCRNTREI
ncbi:hypothetical protein HpHA54_07520 [Helicobacter pylori]